MSWLDYFFRKRTQQTAHLAKERLQVIVAHERAQRNSPEYLQQLQQEIMDVIAKYVNVDREQVQVAFEQKGDLSVLELNITLPEHLPKITIGGGSNTQTGSSD